MSLLASHRPKLGVDLESGLSVGLVLVTCYWLGSYAYVMFSELELLDEVLPAAAPLPRPRLIAFLRVVVIGGSFGALLPLSFTPLYYAAVAILLELCDIAQGAYVATQVAKVVKYHAFHGARPDRKLEILFDYYLTNPLLARAFTLLVAYFTALILSLASIYYHARQLTGIASALLLLTIVVGEVAITIWRRRRDNRLEAV